MTLILFFIILIYRCYYLFGIIILFYYWIPYNDDLVYFYILDGIFIFLLFGKTLVFLNKKTSVLDKIRFLYLYKNILNKYIR